MSAAELDELVSLSRNEHVSQWEAGGWMNVELDGLLTSDALQQAVGVEREARATYDDQATIRECPEYTPLGAMNEEDRHQLAAGLRELTNLIDRIRRQPLAWTEKATSQVLGGFKPTWRQLHDDTALRRNR